MMSLKFPSYRHHRHRRRHHRCDFCRFLRCHSLLVPNRFHRDFYFLPFHVPMPRVVAMSIMKHPIDLHAHFFTREKGKWIQLLKLILIIYELRLPSREKGCAICLNHLLAVCIASSVLKLT